MAQERSEEQLLRDMINRQQHTCLFLAWNHFGKKDATSATIDHVSAKGFTMIISGPKDAKETKETLFKGGDMSKNMTDIINKSTHAVTPPINVVLFTFMLWIVSITISLYSKMPPALQENVVITLIRNTSMKVISEKVAGIMLYFMVYSHICETVLTIYFMRKLVKNTGAMVSWVVNDLIFGFPVTGKAYALYSAAKKLNNKKNV